MSQEFKFLRVGPAAHGAYRLVAALSGEKVHEVAGRLILAELRRLGQAIPKDLKAFETARKAVRR